MSGGTGGTRPGIGSPPTAPRRTVRQFHDHPHPDGQVSVRLPKPSEHLANAPRGRYILSGRAEFAHRGQEWAAPDHQRESVSYTLTRKPGRGGRYLTASRAIPAMPYRVGRDDLEAGQDVYPLDRWSVLISTTGISRRAVSMHMATPSGPLNASTLTARAPSRRDAQVRHASPNYCTTPAGTASPRSRSKTSTSPTRGPPDEKP